MKEMLPLKGTTLLIEPPKEWSLEGTTEAQALKRARRFAAFATAFCTGLVLAIAAIS